MYIVYLTNSISFNTSNLDVYFPHNEKPHYYYYYYLSYKNILIVKYNNLIF